jgi:Holliday junction resolvase-like predicted endonuclease
VVAWREGILAVVEVKARRTGDFGHPLEAISSAKQLRIRRATQDFLGVIRTAPEFVGLRIASVRYDAAGVEGTNVEIVEDAF